MVRIATSHHKGMARPSRRFGRTSPGQNFSTAKRLRNIAQGCPLSFLPCALRALCGEHFCSRLAGDLEVEAAEDVLARAAVGPDADVDRVRRFQGAELDVEAGRRGR